MEHRQSNNLLLQSISIGNNISQSDARNFFMYIYLLIQFLNRWNSESAIHVISFIQPSLYYYQIFMLHSWPR